jgi:outer membrane lipoprotein-sorting protein
MTHALIVAAALAAAPLPVEVQKVQSKLEHTKSLKAKFTQKRYWAAFNDVVASEGRFEWVREGGKVAWRTDQPQQSELVIENGKATMRFPALKTEQSFDFKAQPAMGAMFDSLVSVMKGDVSKLEPLYDVKMEKGEPLTLGLVPKDERMRKFVEKLTLRFAADANLSYVQVSEPGGDHTDIDFKDVVAEKL